jgi:enoyl-CoA hydratase/carnithine racemase
MVLSGEMISAETALKLGILNEVTEDTKLEETGRSLAQRVAQGPPLVLRTLKRSLYGGIKSVSSQLDSEVEGRIRCFLSEDTREGFQAFLENRSPEFYGQ